MKIYLNILVLHICLCVCTPPLLSPSSSIPSLSSYLGQGHGQKCAPFDDEHRCPEGLSCIAPMGKGAQPKPMPTYEYLCLCPAKTQSDDTDFDGPYIVNSPEYGSFKYNSTEFNKQNVDSPEIEKPSFIGRVSSSKNGHVKKLYSFWSEENQACLPSKFEYYCQKSR